MPAAVLAIALSAALLLPSLARAQECADALVGDAAAPGDLSGYRTLFQQGGVTFYSRILPDAPDSARLVIQNANPVPVEVAFSVQLMAKEGPARGVDAGRRCVRLEPGRYLAGAGTSFGSVTGELSGVRVRNLSLALLGEEEPATLPPVRGRVQEVEPTPRAPVRPAPLPELPVTTTAVPDAPPAARDGDSIAPAATSPAAGEPAGANPAPGGAVRPLQLPAEPAASSDRWLTPGRVLGAIAAALRIVAALVLVTCGAGLALPLLYSLYAVLILTPAALLGRLLRRSAPPARLPRAS